MTPSDNHTHKKEGNRPPCSLLMPGRKEREVQEAGWREADRVMGGV